MKMKKSTRFTLAVAALAAILSPQLPAITSTVDLNNTATQAPADPASTASTSGPVQVKDSLRPIDLYVDILAVHRTYGDSITLRWAINSYPEWVYLTRNGVDIIRVNENSDQFDLDTLVCGLKPLSLDQFRAAYPDETDSLAYLAMGGLYGKGGMEFDNTPYYSSSPGQATEIVEDQKMYLAAAFMAAERRPDLANALALRYTDRTVKEGETYRYFIIPTVEDTTGHLFIRRAIIRNVVNTPYKPGPYDIQLSDSITRHCESVLAWKDSEHGLFNIYRRPRGDKEWTRLNRNPYTPPYEGSDAEIVYADSVPQVGFYEYCVEAYDAFGDMTPKSPAINVFYPDMQAPVGPVITSIVIDRIDGEGDAPEQVYANIYFNKDTIERDFTHYIPLYANSADSLRHWRLLSNQYVAPTDTMMRIDVSHVRTGMMTIAAVDTAGNLGYAMPKLLRVADMQPPKAPTGLSAVTELDGSVVLTWNMQDTLDLHYYDVFFANSLEHEFTKVNDLHVYSRSYVDTVAVDANERYIYYCVRGVDWAMNQGAMSDTLRVLRPNTSTPEMAHLDSLWIDDTMIHTRWVGVGNEIISHYEVYRRREGARQWELHSTYDADSVARNGYIFQIDDAVKPDPRLGYQYSVLTVSHWGLTSGLSPVLTARLIGGNMVNFPLTLDGTYDATKRQSKIAWSVDTSSLDIFNGDEFYFCIWRQGPRDDGFNYITDVRSAERQFVDRLLRPGESAQYRISVRFTDGRMGPTSNTITVTAPSPSTQQ